MLPSPGVSGELHICIQHPQSCNPVAFGCRRGRRRWEKPRGKKFPKFWAGICTQQHWASSAAALTTGSILCQEPAGKPGTIPHREQPWHSPGGCPSSVLPSLPAHRADKPQRIFLQPSSILACGRAAVPPHTPQCDHPGKFNYPKMLKAP